MKSIEKVGKTVDEALTEALIELGAATDEVDIEVISKGSKGLLGFGAKEARVRVTLKEVNVVSETKVKDVLVDNVQEPKVSVSQKKDVKKTPVSDKKVQEVVLNNKNIKEVEKDSEDSVIVTAEEVQRVITLAEGFLKKLLSQMQVECEVNSQVVNNNRISICLEGKNMGMIIGKRGETLDAIQYLTNITANRERTQYIKIMLDTENYRERREETLKKLAYRLSKKAQKARKPIVLEPMNPYDRRIIHSALQTSKIVKTHSEGKEPFRRVVITPINQNRSYR